MVERLATGKGVREQAADDAGVPERLAARAYLYALFQHLFAEEPNESFVQAVDAELAREAFVLMGGTACDAEAFGKALAGLEDVPARRIDYARLFVGPGALPAPPWESVWKFKDGSPASRWRCAPPIARRASYPSATPRYPTTTWRLSWTFSPGWPRACRRHGKKVIVMRSNGRGRPALRFSKSTWEHGSGLFLRISPTRARIRMPRISRTPAKARTPQPHGCWKGSCGWTRPSWTRCRPH